MRPLVIIESPYAGDIEANTEYARRCLWDSIERGEAPFASHLLYPQVLDESIPEERILGITLGMEWLGLLGDARHGSIGEFTPYKNRVLQVFYLDKGMSPGMLGAFKTGQALGIRQELRHLDK